MKLKLILCIVLLTIALCGQAAAQDLLDIYDGKTMYIHYSVLGDGFVRNGQIMPFGLLGSKLAEEMTGSEFALDEMQVYRKYKIAGAATGLVSTAFGITGIILVFHDSESRTFEVTSLIFGAVCGLLSDGFNRAAMAAMNRAVWLYNRDVMSGQLRW
jgi:hypothetical protein